MIEAHFLFIRLSSDVELSFCEFFDAEILAYICGIFSVLTNCLAGSCTNNATDFRNPAETSLVINDINSKLITPKLEFPPGL